MTTQREPDVGLAHPGSPLKTNNTSAGKPRRKIPVGVSFTEGGTVPQPEAEGEQRESLREPIRQALFQRKSNKALKLPNGYLKVAVLIIRWDKSIDDFKGHTEEIDRLQNIFTDQYNYTCKVHSIKNLKKPQVDLNRAVLNHIYEYDDPNNLLIFYYTGHGDQSGMNDLELSANQNFANSNGSHLPTAFWNSAEEPIRYHMEGDALSILDCCMASTAGMKCRNGLPRTYQLLAASAADAPTCGPGQNSFTTALCESLTELLAEADGGTFLLTQLCERINTKRKSQACLSWDRLRLFKRTVQLGRLEQSAILEDAFCNKDPEQSSLYLRLSFKSIDLENGQIERLAEQLPHACHEADVPLHRIDWVRMTISKRQATETPSILHDVPFGVDDQCMLDAQADGMFDVNGNDMFEPQTIDLYRACRTINAAQKVRTAFKRRQAYKHQHLKNAEASTSPCIPLWAIILNLFLLLFAIGLMYFRGDKTGLVLWGVILMFTLPYGLCKASATRIRLK